MTGRTGTHRGAGVLGEFDTTGLDLTWTLGEALAGRPEDADEVGEALWGLHPGDPRLVAFAVQLGPQLDVSRALEWAVRVRSAGHADRCPLVELAHDPRRPVADRLRAAALLAGPLRDERGREALRAAAMDADPDDFAQYLLELDVLGPALLPEFVAAASGERSRALAMADVLDDLGATEEARILREHES
jgi:hypothetical protein